MLVDDHGLFREGTTLLLKSIDPGIEVDVARTAQDCLDKASRGGIDLVFLDLGLPDRPGLDALSDLKTAFPELPVVVLSGHEDRETVLEAIKRGAMGASGAITVPASVTPRERTNLIRGASLGNSLPTSALTLLATSKPLSPFPKRQSAIRRSGMRSF